MKTHNNCLQVGVALSLFTTESFIYRNLQAHYSTLSLDRMCVSDFTFFTFHTYSLITFLSLESNIRSRNPACPFEDKTERLVNQYCGSQTTNCLKTFVTRFKGETTDLLINNSSLCGGIPLVFGGADVQGLYLCNSPVSTFRV